MRITFRSLPAFVALLVTPALRAQVPEPVSKPSPEHQKLAYFAGRWNSTGEMKAGPMGPGGAVTATSTCEWFTGGYYLLCRSEGRNPGGETKGLGILGYSASRKRYTYYGIDNSNMAAEPAYGEVTGSTWKWEWEMPLGPQTLKGRYLITQASADKYTWKWEVAAPGGEWTLVGEGTDTRAK